MAIPIRLLAGPNGEVHMDLIAQSIDMAVDRNISAFPTPNNVLARFAVDTNTPRITMDISGILVDDDGSPAFGAGEGSLPMRTLINFGSMFPSENVSPHRPFRTVVDNSGFALTAPQTFPIFTAHTGFTKESTNTVLNLKTELSAPNIDNVEYTGRVEKPLAFASGYSAGSTSLLTVKTTVLNNGSPVNIASDPSLLGAEALLTVGSRLVLEDGSLLGIVTGLTSTTVQFDAGLGTAVSTNDRIYVNPKCFNQRGESLGFVDTIEVDNTTGRYSFYMVDPIEQTLLAGDTISLNDNRPRLLDALHNQQMKIVPSYWLEDPTRSPSAQVPTSIGDGLPANMGIRLKFDANKTSTIVGGSDRPSVVPTSRAASYQVAGYTWNYPARDAVITVPVGGILDVSGGNPAVLLAQMVEDALTNPVVTSATISQTNLMPVNDKTLSGVLNVIRNGPTLLIEQRYVPDAEIEHPQIMSTAIAERFSPQVFTTSAQYDSASTKSAGDKAQDLIGLVSNSEQGSDLFRGVQIPYDSLITSSGINGVARNFFLTFGSVPATEKGSSSNTRPASLPMRDLLLDTSAAGGNLPDEGTREKGILGRFIDAVIPDDVEDLLGFLVNASHDLMVTLAPGSARHNDGGVRILPEKLHVRHEAGKNYYTFDLTLVATDYVIGV